MSVSRAAWLIGAAFVDGDSSIVLAQPVHPLTAELVTALPNLIEVRDASGRLLAAGGLDDNGWFVEADRLNPLPAPGTALFVYAEVLGVDAEALA